MTEVEWRAYYEYNLEKHELFSVLSLFAACEGGIRRDFDWRVQGDGKKKHHQRFKKLFQSSASGDRIAVAVILGQWLAAEKGNVWLRAQLKLLKDLFVQRNDLAHGRSGMTAAFDVIFTKLIKIQQKWRDGVDDFRGY